MASPCVRKFDSIRSTTLVALIQNENGWSIPCHVSRVLDILPSREWTKNTYPSMEKGKSSTQKCLGMGYVSFQEGIQGIYTVDSWWWSIIFEHSSHLSVCIMPKRKDCLPTIHFQVQHGKLLISGRVDLIQISSDHSMLPQKTVSLQVF